MFLKDLLNLILGRKPESSQTFDGSKEEEENTGSSWSSNTQTPPVKVWWNEVEESSQVNRSIIQKIESMGYKFTQEKHGMDIYKVNDQGYISDDIYFTINWQYELLKTERNATQIIGKCDSREDCLLEMYFKLKRSHVGIDRKKIKEFFADAKDLNDIESLLRNMYGDEFVSNNIFFNRETLLRKIHGDKYASTNERFNQDMLEDSGFYIDLSNNELWVFLKQGNYFTIEAVDKFEERHLAMKRLIELIAKKTEFDKLITDLGISMEDQKYIVLFSNYCFGFVPRIHEIEENA